MTGVTPTGLGGGIQEVTDRIAAIEQRFAPADRFAAVLANAQAQVGPSQGAAPTGAADQRSARLQGSAQVLHPAGCPHCASGASEWASALPERGRAWAPAIDQAAREAGIDPRLMAAVVWAESGFRADARSHAGAIGLAQLMPGTAAGLGVDPHDPEQNLRGGARYLAAQIERFGRVDHALAAYNAGPGRVLAAGGIPDIAETRAYVPRVLGYLSRLGGAA